jgi:transcriptional regulator with XRE-family HTH domain
MSEDYETRGSRPRPDALDVHVGSRLRARRLMLGLTQEQLGDAVGLTFQQIQKYERGINRMGASRLWELARALGVPIGWFYQDSAAATAVRPAPGFAMPAQEPFGVTAEREEMPGDARDLLDAFARIADPVVRQRILELVKSLAPPRPDTY